MKKIYYTQKELSEIINEETHVIRYWEANYPQLVSRSTQNGRKVYTKKHVELFLFVKQLIRNEKLTNTGVKEQLAILLTKNKITGTTEILQNDNDRNIKVKRSQSNSDNETKFDEIKNDIDAKIEDDYPTVEEKVSRQTATDVGKVTDNSPKETLITFTQEEFLELLQVMQKMIALIKLK